MTDRELKQIVFIRVCRDSGFNMNFIDAAILTANVLNCHPMDIWVSIGGFNNMKSIALGNHPMYFKGV